MTTYEDYVKAQETRDNFRLKATLRVAEYVNAGLADVPLNVRVHSADMPEGTYSVEFNMSIAPLADGTVPVSLLTWNTIQHKNYDIRVPFGVVAG